MVIKNYLEWNGKYFYGTVNVGSHPDDDPATLATEALVFCLVFVKPILKILLLMV